MLMFIAGFIVGGLSVVMFFALLAMAYRGGDDD